MNDTHPLIESEARQRIAERAARAGTPHLPRVPQRHRVATGLRRVADRLDG